MRWWERRSEPAATCGEIAEAPLATPPARRRGVRSRGVDVMTRRGAIRIRKPVARDIESASADPGTCRARGGPTYRVTSAVTPGGDITGPYVLDDQRKPKRYRLYTSSDRPSSDSSHESSGIHEAPGSLKRRHRAPGGRHAFLVCLKYAFPSQHAFPVSRASLRPGTARAENARAPTHAPTVGGPWRTDTAL